MKTSIIYLVIFTVCAINGAIHDWNSWLFGFAFGIAIYDVTKSLWLE